MSEKYLELFKLLVEANKNNDETEIDRICDELDVIWYAMSGDERRNVQHDIYFGPK